MSSLFKTPDGKNVAFTFALVSSLFLLWGLCNGMIDVMDKHFQNELHLSKSQSAGVQFAHYLGYLLMAWPAGWLARKLGYKGGIIAGLLLVALGGFWFIPATHIASFWAFLLGVCLIASGLAFLETVANPYTTVLGDPELAATRINLAQSCNGIGWIFGPIIGGAFFYSTDSAGRSTGAETLYIPYACVAVVVLALAIIFYFANVPDVKAPDDYHLDDSVPTSERKSIWAHPHFVFAVVAQFFYVAAQAGIFSFFINYVTEETPAVSASLVSGWNSFAEGCPSPLADWFGGWFKVGSDAGFAFTDKAASNLASIGFVLFLLGRLTGAWILKNNAAHRVLGVYGVLSVAMCLLVFLKLGWFSVLALFLSYFFMSIMFPTIFALGIHGLGQQAKKAAPFIVMAIMGGMFLPKLMGYVADKSDMSRGFIIPVVCLAIVAAYGFGWSRLSKSGGTLGLAPAQGH